MLDLTQYQNLQEDIKALYAEFEALKKYKECLKKEYAQVKVFLEEEWTVKHEFPQLSLDLNLLIQNYNDFETPSLLIPKLKEHFENIRIVDSGIDDLRAKYDACKHVPNRNGWAEAIKKIKTFLEKLPLLPLRDLDHTANVLLPKALNVIHDVEQAVKVEQAQWSAIQQDALEFKSLLASHTETIDKYSFAQIYAEANHFVNRLLRSPDMTNLYSEARDLSTHKKAINQCLEQFQIELNEIQNYSPDWGRMWKEDALRIQNLQNQACLDIYTSSMPLLELEREVSVVIKRKHSDIQEAIKPFKESIQTYFQSEIHFLETTCSPFEDLRLLIEKMNRHESLVRRQRHITIAIWAAGIIVVSLLSYGGYLLAKAHPIEFGIALVLLIFAAYKFYS